MSELGDLSARVAHRMSGRPSLTAEAVTLARAIEHLRPPHDQILDDQHAARFLSAAARAALTSWKITGPASRIFERLDTGFIPSIACRHRYIDEQLLAAIANGVEQVVLLGAGYDSRAYRFAVELGDRPVFEVDLPAIGDRKAAIIADHPDSFGAANVHRVAIDFESQSLSDVLSASAFRRNAPTFVAWEGVNMYLTRAAVKSTLIAVHDLCGPGSAVSMDGWFLADDPSPEGSVRRALPGALSLIGEPVTFGIHPEEMPYFLGLLGWEVSDIATGDQLGELFDRSEPWIPRST